MNPTNISTGLPPHTRRRPSLAPRMWAASVMLVSSLFLVFFAGCFLIGVLGLTRPELFMGNPGGNPVPRPVSLSAEEQVLFFTLYGLAFGSALGAVILFVLGLRALWPVFRWTIEGSDD